VEQAAKTQTQPQAPASQPTAKPKHLRPHLQQRSSLFGRAFGPPRPAITSTPRSSASPGVPACISRVSSPARKTWRLTARWTAPSHSNGHQLIVGATPPSSIPKIHSGAVVCLRKRYSRECLREPTPWTSGPTVRSSATSPPRASASKIGAQFQGAAIEIDPPPNPSLPEV